MGAGKKVSRGEGEAGRWDRLLVREWEGRAGAGWGAERAGEAGPWGEKEWAERRKSA